MTPRDDERQLADSGELGENEIRQWLLDQPDFLARNPAVLAALRIPDESGTTSLLERQVQVLREQNRRLNRQLNHLSHTAGENEQLMQRLHRLSIELMAADSTASMAERLVSGLRDDFSADATTLMISGCPAGFQKLDCVLEMPDPRPPWLDELLASGQPQCGRLTRVKRELAFGARQAELASAALVPLGDHGLLAIGAASADRFHPGMGTLFLELLGETLQSRLALTALDSDLQRVQA